MKTRTPAEIKAATDEVYSRMSHQPKRRGYMTAPPTFAIDTLACTDPRCSSRRCYCAKAGAR